MKRLFFLTVIVFIIVFSSISYINSKSVKLKFIFDRVISFDQNPTIFFRDALGINKYNQIEKNVTISPQINGHFIWTDNYTLRFIFDDNKEKIKPGEYNLIIKSGKFIDGAKKEKIPFNVTSLNLQNMEWIIKPVSQEFTSCVINLEFSENINKIDVENGLTVKLEDKKCDYIIQNKEYSKLSIKINNIPRKDEKQKLLLTFDKNIFYLEENIERQINIPEHIKIKFYRLITSNIKNKLGLILLFNSYLKENQNLENYIRINPSLKNVKYEIRDNKIKISGDFIRNKKYKIFLDKSIEGRWGESLDKNVVVQTSIEDEKEDVMFSENGTFISSLNLNKIRFRTLNVDALEFIVYKVFEENVNFFLDNQTLNNLKKTDNYLYGINRFGKIVAVDTLLLKQNDNVWHQNELDLTKFIKRNKNGLYFIALKSIDKNKYKPTSLQAKYLKSDAIKPIYLSDIAMTLKKDKENIIVAVTNIIDGKPIKGTNVKIYSRANEIIREGNTDKKGMVIFSMPKEDFHFVKGVYKKQKSFISFNDMKWNISTFDVGGRSLENPEKFLNNGKKLKGFMYTNRDLFSPGDDLAVSFILRDENNEIPDNLTLNFYLYNEKNKKIVSSLIKSEYKGFYSKIVKLPQDLEAGYYSVVVDCGKLKVRERILVEKFVPDKFRVNIKTPQNKIFANKKQIELNTSAEFLFGAPAKNFDFNVKAVFSPQKIFFKKFSEFNFNDDISNINFIEKNIKKGKLNKDGKADFIFDIPIKEIFDESIPPIVNIDFEETISDSFGLSGTGRLSVKYHPYQFYVGAKCSNEILNIGENKIDFVVLDSSGKIIPNKSIDVNIFYNKRLWWWEYQSWDRIRFKEDESTKIVYSERFQSGNKVKSFNFSVKQWGQYQIELSVIDENDIIHKTVINRSTVSYREDRDILTNTGKIFLDKDKNIYNIGDVAKIYFDAPKKSNVFLSVEQGNTVKYAEWKEIKIENKKQFIEIPVTKDLIPNFYASISIVQPLENINNDLPVRQFSIVSIPVIDKKTNLRINVEMSEILLPLKNNKIKIMTEPNTLFTISLVDQGVLSKSNFKAPAPWKYFYQKIMNNIKTYDNYSHFLGNLKGDVEKIFSIGGGEFKSTSEQDYFVGAPNKMGEEIEKNLVDRFKAMEIYKGVLSTDENGFAEVIFDIPDYYGAVKMTVIAANKNAFGSYEKIIPVKSDLVMDINMPKTIKSGDIFYADLEIFPQNKSISDLILKADISDKFKVLSNIPEKINLKQNKKYSMKLQAKETIGVGKIEFIAEVKNKKFIKTVELAVTPPNSYSYESFSAKLEPKQNKSFSVNHDFIEDTFFTNLEFSLIPNFYFQKNVEELLDMEIYGISDLISAGLNLLVAKDIMSMSENQEKKIDDKIKKIINNLKEYQNYDGSIADWQRKGDFNSSYASIFLYKAKSKGYIVDAIQIDKLIRYLEDASRIWVDSNKSFMQTFRLFALNINGKNVFSELNRLKENHLKEMTSTEKWLLAASYSLAGEDNVAEFIIENNKDYSFADKNEKISTFMKNSFILMAKTILNKKDEFLVKSNINILKDSVYRNITENGLALFALSNYYTKNFDKKNVSLEYVIENKVETVHLKNPITTIPISVKNREKIKVKNDIYPVTVNFNYGGIINKYIIPTSQNGIRIERIFCNQNGEKIDMEKLKLGDIVYCKISVFSDENFYDNILLSQVIPSGWEIVSKNMNAVNYNQNEISRLWIESEVKKEYIRDDRISWLFDLNKNSRTVVFKFTAKYKGKFLMPSTFAQSIEKTEVRAYLKGNKIIVE